MQIRLERPQDVAAIRRVTEAAFQTAQHSDQTEARIVDALRDAGALTLSLVATESGEIVGHAAFSPVRIDGRPGEWFGLAPVSVHPDHQGKGVGSALVREGLARLEALQAAGCVVLGEPSYYGRFGFVSDPALRYRTAPPGYFQRVVFAGDAPVGAIEYHPGFDVA